MLRNAKNAIACFAALVLFGGSADAQHLETFTEPYARVAVPAPEIGVVAEILVREGDEVLKTQRLARLDDSVLQASMLVARAAKEALGNRQNAESELRMRQTQLESYRRLHEQGNATQRELEQAENDYRKAVSRLQSVREELEVRRLEYEQVKAQLQQRVITSTIDGFVVAIEKQVGEFVSPTDPIIMHVVHLKSLKAVFSVPTHAARDLQAGRKVSLVTGYEHKRCQGVVEFVSPIADAESNTVRVKIKIPNKDLRIQSGVACRWHLDVDEPAFRNTNQPPRNSAMR